MTKMNEFVCIGEVALRDKTGEYSEPVAVYVRREDLKRITMGDLVETFAKILENVKGGGRAWDT